MSADLEALGDEPLPSCSPGNDEGSLLGFKLPEWDSWALLRPLWKNYFFLILPLSWSEERSFTSSPGQGPYILRYPKHDTVVSF